MSQKLTISLPDNLINLLDGLAAAWETTRSGVFARLLSEKEKEHLGEEMAKGYKATSETDIEVYLPAQSEAALRNEKPDANNNIALEEALELLSSLKVAEPVFEDWDNEEDAVYDDISREDEADIKEGLADLKAGRKVRAKDVWKELGI